jgi:Anti-sigma-28 factor, FlgM
MPEGNRQMRVAEIQQRVGRGEYRVDTRAVAEAIVRRLLAEHILPGAAKRDHEECS